MSYIGPSLTDMQIQMSIRRLMRQAYIKAYWPPGEAKPEEMAKLTCVAVAFNNLYLLFDNDYYDWKTAESKQVKRRTRQTQIDAFKVHARQR